MNIELEKEIEVNLEQIGPQGLSAYEVYVKNGGTLSETEWLESLKGKDGINGSDGLNGKDGENGITPTIGDNGNWYLADVDTGKPSRGEQGPQGIQGEAGPTYTAGENITIDENNVISASGGDVPVYFIENANSGNGYLANYYGLVGKTSEFTEILNDVATKGSSSFIISCYSTSSTNGRSAPGILYQAYKFTLSKSGGFINLSGFFYGRSTTSPYRPEANVHNVQILYSYNSSNNKYNCTEVKLLSNDKITMALASDVLMKTNTTPYTPTAEYQPSTKIYTDKTHYEKMTGYDATKTQVLKNINGTLTWVDEV